MSGQLRSSPARVLQRVLIDLGMGVTPTGVASDVWPVYFAGEPDVGSPDGCITVFNTEGLIGPRRMNDGGQHEYEGVQVRVRSRTHEEGWVKANAIAVCLDSTLYWEGVTIDGIGFLIQSVSRTSPVISLGKEREASKRNLFTVNAVMTLAEGDPDPVTVGELTDESGDELLEGD